jgi:hypothetical protein
MLTEKGLIFRQTDICSLVMQGLIFRQTGPVPYAMVDGFSDGKQ